MAVTLILSSSFRIFMLIVTIRNKICKTLCSFNQVSGPESKRKAVEAGLLNTVIDLLETPEPVQVRHSIVIIQPNATPYNTAQFSAE